MSKCFPDRPTGGKMYFRNPTAYETLPWATALAWGWIMTNTDCWLDSWWRQGTNSNNKNHHLFSCALRSLALHARHTRNRRVRQSNIHARSKCERGILLMSVRYRLALDKWPMAYMYNARGRAPPAVQAPWLYRNTECNEGFLIIINPNVSAGKMWMKH